MKVASVVERMPDHSTLTTAEAAWRGVSAAFAALGRVFICLDDRGRIIHASMTLDDLPGPGSSCLAEGRPIEDLLGAGLFGASGVMRAALDGGGRRKGWRADLCLDDRGPRVVSVSAALFPRELFDGCDARVRSVVVVRPADEDRDTACDGPASIGGLVARSPGMLGILTLIENLSHSDATVLITGESGTGKEVVARALHERSPRRTAPCAIVWAGSMWPRRARCSSTKSATCPWHCRSAGQAAPRASGRHRSADVRRGVEKSLLTVNRGVVAGKGHEAPSG